MIDARLAPWQVRATNLPEHARNPIHTDAGGRAAGFEGALVAGVTTYAYLCHVPLAGWGEHWLANGGGEVRFRRPVLDGDLLDLVPISNDDDDHVTIEVRSSRPDQPRAILRCSPSMGPAQALRPGEPLADVVAVLDGALGADYAQRAGDDLDLTTRLGLVHPAVWPSLANDVMHNQLARGAWIHTRSIIRHHRAVPIGATAVVRSRLVDRFQSHGERALVDMHITVDDVVVASLEHEAIIALP